MSTAPPASPDDIRDEKAGRDAEDRRFLNRGSAYMLLDNASKVLEPLLVLLCARLYAGGDWGIFKYYESLTLLLTRLGSLGLDRGVVWMYSRCPDDEAFARRFARAANLVLLASSALSAALLLQGLGLLPDLGRWTDKVPEIPAGSLALFLASVPVQALTLLFLQSFLNKRALLPGLLVRNLVVPVVTYGPAAALAFTPWKGEGLALPYFLGNLIGLVTAATWYRKLYSGRRVESAARGPRWPLSAAAGRDLLRFSLPIASTDVFMSFAYRVDLLLLGRYSGIQAVEIYAVITMISNTLRSFRQSFDGIVLSLFSSEGRESVSESQRRHFNYATWIVTTLQLPFLFLALLFGEKLLGLVSPAYASGYRVLAIAVLFNLLITPGAFSGQLLIGLGKTWFVPVAQACFFGTSLGLNLLLVPRYAAEGAAAATGMAHLLSGLVTFGGVWAFSGRFMLMPSYLRPMLTGLLILSVPAALHFTTRPGLLVDAAAFLAAVGLFTWHSRSCWRRFNARD
ncbi:MAG TPA: lipopolysaccharide biosynthesis protein [Fibrobacteria bacterium]|nr:lipopolysaccharide biosynthesis protein [Fibrobacteria bacterium]